MELWRAAIRLAKGEGSVAGYVLLLPGGICALWMLVAFLTSSRPNCDMRIDEEELRVAIEKVGLNVTIDQAPIPLRTYITVDFLIGICE